MTRYAKKGKNKEVEKGSEWSKLKNDVNQNKSKFKHRIKPTNHNNKKLGKGSFKFSLLSSEEKRNQRRDVRRTRRGKKAPCFVCRSSKHKASNCPNAEGIGICFKCASTEHTTTDCPKKYSIEGFPHAVCFVCKEKGHLSSKCPDNPRGLYPNGGCCKVCGSVEHFAKNCPQKQQKSRTIKLQTISKNSIEDDGLIPRTNHQTEIVRVKKQNIVKF